MAALERTAGAGLRYEGVPRGIVMNVGAGLVVAADFAAAVIPARDPLARLGLLALVLFWFGTLTTDAVAAAVVVAIGFVLFDGFLVNRYGTLSWHGTADLERILALTAAGALGVLVARWRRRRADRRRFAPIETFANQAGLA